MVFIAAFPLHCFSQNKMDVFKITTKSNCDLQACLLNSVKHKLEFYQKSHLSKWKVELGGKKGEYQNGSNGQNNNYKIITTNTLSATFILYVFSNFNLNNTELNICWPILCCCFLLYFMTLILWICEPSNLVLSPKTHKQTNTKRQGSLLNMVIRWALGGKKRIKSLMLSMQRNREA